MTPIAKAFMTEVGFESANHGVQIYGGLVGHSGSGKSTLVNLICRFHDLDSGRVLIDGQDISGVTQDSLRSHIGMVTQDTSLLHRSVRDNISYSRPGATDEDMRLAARRAGAGRAAPLSEERAAGAAVSPSA